MNQTVKRTIFGVLFLAVMLGGLLFHEIAFIALFAFISGEMLYEFYRICLGSSLKRQQWEAIALGLFLFACGVCQFSGCQWGGKLWGIALILLLAILGGLVLNSKYEDFPKSAYILAGLVYISVPLALSPAVVYSGGQFSSLLMVSFFVIIWSSDVGAYCFGMLFGKNGKKMCPKISPKKSWAGFWGGILSSVIAGAILMWTGLFNFPWYHVIAVSVLMNVTGVVGDLYESLWKRHFGIKDSGNIIPGHGGLMDRFDSSLFAIPVGYVYLLIFQLV